MASAHIQILIGKMIAVLIYVPFNLKSLIKRSLLCNLKYFICLMFYF